MTRRRHQITLDGEISQALERLAPQGSKSALVSEALKLWLARDQDLVSRPAIDPVLRVRLDQDSRRMGRIERDLMILIETIGLFVRYQLSVTAPLPPDDHAAARALGKLRYARFIERVGRMLGQPGSLHRRLIDRLEQEAQKARTEEPARAAEPAAPEAGGSRSGHASGDGDSDQAGPGHDAGRYGNPGSGGYPGGSPGADGNPALGRHGCHPAEAGGEASS